MSSSGSITKLIRRVKRGDGTASQQLVARYLRRLLGVARARIRDKGLREWDEEDVVQSALLGFLRGAKRGQYRQLHDRQDLWHLLVKITTRKARKFVREHEMQKRHPRKGLVRTASLESAEASVDELDLDRVVDPKPSPDLELVAKEEMENLLERLGDSKLRAIAIWKWEGYSNAEIAARLDCNCRTIVRKLRLIRTIWEEEDAP